MFLSPISFLSAGYFRVSQLHIKWLFYVLFSELALNRKEDSIEEI